VADRTFSPSNACAVCTPTSHVFNDLEVSMNITMIPRQYAIQKKQGEVRTVSIPIVCRNHISSSISPASRKINRCLVEDAIKFVIRENTVQMQSAWALFESQAYEVVEDLSLKGE
jgi:hypothetical protein